PIACSAPPQHEQVLSSTSTSCSIRSRWAGSEPRLVLRGRAAGVRLALPAGVILLDDVITNGTTFKAAQRLLAPYLRGRKFVGLFLARRVFPPIEWPDV